jgi:ribosomal protein S12 methylthiotransferase accessory factor
MAHSANLDQLCQPLGGLIHGNARFGTPDDEPGLITRLERLGDISQARGESGIKRNGKRPPEDIQGAGVGLTDQDAALRARGEALERYCTSLFSKDQFIEASADELGKEALDLDTVPRCSPAELANRKCPLTAPDKKVPIRWVKSVSLMSGQMVYVPVVMTYLHAGFAMPGERFCFPITTGCAGYTSLDRAILKAILEVIERDAVSISWLQQLPLPRIEIDGLPPEQAEYWGRYQRSSQDLEYMFFDATTDLGVPTIYGVQRCRANRRLTTMVSCGTATRAAEAIVGDMREMASCRTAFRRPKTTPDQVEDFHDIFHGATYMARAEHAGAFDFLLNSSRTRSLGEIASIDGDDRQILQVVLERLRRLNMQVYAVELSTDEALRAGVRVVRVIIPGLQPISFNQRARYLGHPRLYQAPRNMGYEVRSEAELNPWPQPFA